MYTTTTLGMLIRAISLKHKTLRKRKKIVEMKLTMDLHLDVNSKNLFKLVIYSSFLNLLCTPNILLSSFYREILLVAREDYTSMLHSTFAHQHLKSIKKT